MTAEEHNMLVNIYDKVLPSPITNFTQINLSQASIGGTSPTTGQVRYTLEDDYDSLFVIVSVVTCGNTEYTGSYGAKCSGVTLESDGEYAINVITQFGPKSATYGSGSTGGSAVMVYTIYSITNIKAGTTLTAKGIDVRLTGASISMNILSIQ